MNQCAAGVGMNVVECSREKPWGIHPALRDDLCPRCGWSAPAPILYPRVPPPAWLAIDGALGAAA
jgi:hypothetical protein